MTSLLPPKRRAAVATLLLASLAAPDALAQPTVSARVSHAEGPVTAQALSRALPARLFVNCQNTFMGGAMWLRLRALASGALRVDTARYSGEPIAQYIPCVRRVIGRARVAPSTGETVAGLQIVFPALGLAPR